MNMLERAARSSDPGYLSSVWSETNGTWSEPPEEELRAFLAALGREAR